MWSGGKRLSRKERRGEVAEMEERRKHETKNEGKKKRKKAQKENKS